MPPDDRSTVEQALATFLDAFSNLDRPRVEACFTDDATAINAWGGRRQDGFWCDEFDSWRATRPGPPYLHLDQTPGLRFQLVGRDVTVVTFHLDSDPGMERRRTLVFVRTDAGWQIAHLHASNAPRPV
jgi:ketosteroid isomerase-like protein